MNKSKYYFWIFTTISFCLPLIFLPISNEFYEFQKMYFIYFFGGTFLFIYFWDVFLNDKLINHAPLYIKIFLISLILSTLFSMHLYTSVWGYYTRFTDGLLSHLLFFCLYLYVSSNFDRGTFYKYWTIITFTIFPISIYGLFQAGDTPRVFSTFGQPNWLGQYLALMTPFVLYLFFAEKKPYLWLMLSFFGFTGIWLSYSLSALAGFGVAFLLLVIYFMRIREGAVFYKKLGLIILFYVVLILVSPGIIGQRLKDIYVDFRNVTRNVENVFAQTQENAITVTSQLSDPGFIRLGLWRSSLKLFVSSSKVFLIGTGPETYPYAYQPYRALELNRSSEWNYVFNKPHNYYLELAVEQGLLGTIIYFYLLYILFKKLETPYKFGLVAFSITNIFGWPTVTTHFMFWILLASINLMHIKGGIK